MGIELNREFSEYETQMAEKHFTNVELGKWRGGRI